MIAIVAIVAVGMAAAGWAAAQFVTVPEQAAARASAPVASLVTLPVESRVVSDDIVTRGTVTSLRTINAVAGRTVAGTSAVIITKLPYVSGSDVAPGSVIAELSGQPIIAFQGNFQGYRDLDSGMSGPDVLQLQAALTSLGYKSVKRDKPGHYDTGTGDALKALYKKLGYDERTLLPASATLFVPTLPAQLEYATAKVGDPVATTSIDISMGNLAVLVDQDAQISSVVHDGAKATLTSELLNASVPATVISAAAADPPTPAVTSPAPTAGVPDAADSSSNPTITVTPDSPLPREWLGQDVRVTFNQASTNGNVLAVPVNAVTMSGAGNPQVIVVSGTTDKPKRRTVSVTVGVTGGGYVEILKSEQPLSVGDQVLIGLHG